MVKSSIIQIFHGTVYSFEYAKTHPENMKYCDHLWLIHTAQDRDRERDWERDRERWISILCYLLFTLHRDWERDRERGRGRMGSIPIFSTGSGTGKCSFNGFYIMPAALLIFFVVFKCRLVPVCNGAYT